MPKTLQVAPAMNHEFWTDGSSIRNEVVGIENIATPTPNQPICVKASTDEGMYEP